MKNLLLSLFICLITSTVSAQQMQYLLFDGVESHSDVSDVHCLAEGTRITMSDRSIKNIEDVNAGDKVIAFDDQANTPQCLDIVTVHAAVHEEVFGLLLDNGMTVVATADHPFLSADGWRSLNPQKTEAYGRYTDVKKYKVGTELIVVDKDGKTDTSAIVSIEKMRQTIHTYTLELERDGAFIANGILVGQE